MNLFDNFFYYQYKQEEVLLYLYGKQDVKRKKIYLLRACF